MKPRCQQDKSFLRILVCAQEHPRAKATSIEALSAFSLLGSRAAYRAWSGDCVLHLSRIGRCSSRGQPASQSKMIYWPDPKRVQP